MSKHELEAAYNQIIEMMMTLYSICHLVHADLSEYNILWWQKEVNKTQPFNLFSCQSKLERFIYHFSINVGRVKVNINR